MLYIAKIVGESGLLQHSSAGLDPTDPRSVEINEITKKRGTNRTESDELRLKELECERALWLYEGKPTIPHAAIRATIEKAARTLKQGPLVRSGLIVQSVEFEFDEGRHGSTVEDWRVKCQHTVPVVVNRVRILRTRALFEPPWSATATIFGAEDLVDAEKIRTWLDIAGTQVGIGDWRPEKSGPYGRFRVESVEKVE